MSFVSLIYPQTVLSTFLVSKTPYLPSNVSQQEEDFEFAVLQKKVCPFCRTTVEI